MSETPADELIGLSQGDADEVRQLLKDHQLRCTASRLLTAYFLRTAGRPCSHQEVLEALKPYPFDQSTIFRNLVDFVQSGLAFRIEVGDHVWRYEWAIRGQQHAVPHAHFFCIDCERLDCLRESLDGRLWAAPHPDIGVIIEATLKGYCTACLQTRTIAGDSVAADA